MEAASFKMRIKALFIDYLCIVIYLLLLFVLAISMYYLFLDGIPNIKEGTSQFIAFLTTVLPVTIFYTVKESKIPYASYGKKKAKIRLSYTGNPLVCSIIRNVLKFMPWQLAHMAVIRGIYKGFDSFYVSIIYIISILLPIIYIVMVILRKDHRHIPDMLSGSYVVVDREL